MSRGRSTTWPACRAASRSAADHYHGQDENAADKPASDQDEENAKDSADNAHDAARLSHPFAIGIHAAGLDFGHIGIAHDPGDDGEDDRDKADADGRAEELADQADQAERPDHP